MPGNPLSDPNWARDVTDTVDRVVGQVRDRTTSNIVLAARGVVFGLLVAVLGIVAFVLALIVVTRGVQALLDLAVTTPRAVYLSYFIVGGICCLVGAFLMVKRHSTSA
jgi:uncharacterized protein YacL